MHPTTLMLILSAGGFDLPPKMPIPNDYSRSVLPRWERKPVLESRLLDDAESLDAWQVVNVDQAKGEIATTSARSHKGAKSLRLTCPTVGDRPVPDERYFGTASALRKVNGEDWSAWNRVSFWVYPDMPGFRNVSMIATLHNEGKLPVPDEYRKMGVNYLILKNRQWNHVVWEIPNLPRDRVTGLDFAYRMQGKEPGATDRATFYFDHIELQRVNADHYEGWNVAPGAIAYSHSGYQTGAVKRAHASDLTAKSFQLLDARTGKTVFEGKPASTQTQIGRFQVMDFSPVRRPGTYLLKAGGRKSRPFRIDDNPWRASLWKAINFYYVQRCGYAIPGVHDTCHRDWLLLHGDQRMVLNGGWHDAGDLSQNLTNTAEAAYEMFRLAERLRLRNDDPALVDRLIQEATWGLDWVLKTTFHDGFRPGFSQLDRWTDGIVGNVDDVTARAGNNQGANYAAAATEAIAARVLKRTDPILAGYALRQAEEDWRFAAAASPNRRYGSVTESNSHAIVAAVELHKATGKTEYADKAIELATAVVESQQKEFLPELTYPLAGLFYSGPDKSRVLRYNHLSHEDAPLAALTALCDQFPNHPDWIRWYGAVTRYAEYFQKPMARFTQPYGMLPNSVYREDDKAEGMFGLPTGGPAESIRKGVPVGPRHFVRLFPVWGEFRGNHGTILSQMAGLAEAAHLRNDLALTDLGHQQLEWVVGRNPFAQSTMWGEGYDYAPQYTAMSGDIVGSLPVGFQTRRNEDVPYWPTENCHNWKETWVVPVTRWLSLMSTLTGAAQVSGKGVPNSQVRFWRDGSNYGKDYHFVKTDAAGNFRASLPEGRYAAWNGEFAQLVTLLPASQTVLDLTSRGVDMLVESRTESDGTVVLRAVLTGKGRHQVKVRSDNVRFDNPSVSVMLTGVKQPRVIEWRGRVESPRAPWVAVLIPDGNLSRRREATGARPEFALPSPKGK